MHCQRWTGVSHLTDDQLQWFGVRCLFIWSRWDGKPYEERITLWRARSLDHAIELAEQDAEEYAADGGPGLLHLSKAYAIAEGIDIESGAEVFSLLRDSDLEPDDYLSAFFATGREHMQESPGDTGNEQA